VVVSRNGKGAAFLQHLPSKDATSPSCIWNHRGFLV
jgi:hypothetical protein